MSYCRFYDWDVSVYDDINGGITISTRAAEDYNEPTRTAAILRLEELRSQGLNVPEYVIEDIKRDLQNRGETEGLEPMRKGDNK